MKNTITLKKQEFILLLAVLGVGQLVGVEDTLGMDTMDEASFTKAWENAKEGLKAKAYIGKETEEGLEMDERLVKALIAYNKAKSFIHMQLAHEGVNIFEEKYLASEEGILAMKTEEDEVILEADKLEDGEAAYDLLKSYIQEEAEDVMTEKVVLDKKSYYALMSSMNMKKPEKAAELFMANGMSEELAKDAADGFFKKRYYLSLTKINLKAQRTKEVLMCYKGKKSYYCMRYIEESLVIETISSEILKNTVRHYFM